METQNVISTIKDQYGLRSYPASLVEFLLRTMFWVANAFFVFFCNHMVSVLQRIFGYFIRFEEENRGGNRPDCSSFSGKHEDQFGEIGWEMLDSVFFGERENFVPDSVEENRGEEESSVDEVGILSNASTNQYRFQVGNSLSGFIEEAQTASFKVQELFASEDQSINKQEKVNTELYTDNNFLQFNCKDQKVRDVATNSTELSISEDGHVIDSHPSIDLHGSLLNLEVEVVNHDKKPEVSIRSSSCEEDLEKQEEEDTLIQQDCSEREDSIIMQDNFFGKHDFSEEVGVCPENHLVSHDSEQRSFSLDDDLVSINHEFSPADGKESFLGKHKLSDESGSCPDNLSFLNDTTLNDDLFHAQHEFSSDCQEIFSEESASEVLEPKTPMGIGEKRVDFDEDSPRSVENTEEETESQHFIVMGEGDVSGHEFDRSEHRDNDEGSAFNSTKSMGVSEKCDGFGGEEMASLCSDADDEMEGEDVLLKHKEMVQQMKKEMRNLKIKGLPTILEESESPRMVEDLKPLKVEEKIEHKDRMEEIQMFYKSYSDKMRRMDILNHQTTYAIGFLQLKNQDKLASKRNALGPVTKSLLPPNFRPHNLRRHEADPLQNLMRDLQKDLELAYVGQLCLSWEILKWQCHKATEFREYDANCLHQYNVVAAEFEQFQVLVQRFTEDEPFQGPRIQNYLKSRYVLANLLQVPLIKDDPKNGRKGEGRCVVSIARLIEIIEESMRAFWGFLRADKAEANMTLKIIQGSQVDLQDPSDMEFLTEIQANFQKKERRLKDLIRSGNCIVKKFQKRQDCRLNHNLFVAQVELRLVSRVLIMSRLTTDQLQWCHKKLSKINLVSRKVHIDSSFLLFPC